MAIREIIFRGKRVDNGKWTEGYFFKSWDKVFLLWGMTGDCPNMEEVIPETVGQFTGLYDKNGKKIFEGDIVESPNGTQGFIEWQNAECAFLVNIGDDWQTMDDCPYEVVGNIYDNKGYEE